MQVAYLYHLFKIQFMLFPINLLVLMYIISMLNLHNFYTVIHEHYINFVAISVPGVIHDVVKVRHQQIIVEHSEKQASMSAYTTISIFLSDQKIRNYTVNIKNP